MGIGGEGLWQEPGIIWGMKVLKHRSQELPRESCPEPRISHCFEVEIPFALSSLD